jgi:hypothetical protein
MMTTLLVCAHASFEDPNATDDTPPNESVEVRTIIVTPVEDSY